MTRASERVSERNGKTIRLATELPQELDDKADGVLEHEWGWRVLRGEMPWNASSVSAIPTGQARRLAPGQSKTLSPH
jgi:hypothetical protein